MGDGTRSILRRTRHTSSYLMKGSAMRKKILMIGNTDGLPGVPIDINDYYDFFTSPTGGDWYDEEIDILLNPTQHELLETIADIEEANYDYLITVFSGHGEETSDGTVLSINGERETVLLHNLTNLAERQLLIIDCCRSHHRIPADISIDSATLSLSRDSVRQAYEELIKFAAPQEVILFSCNDNETSVDTREGWIYSYSQCLLNAIQIALTNSRLRFVSVGRAHYKAVSLMKQAYSPYEQNPTMLQSPCSVHRRLPLAVNVEVQ